MSKKNVCKKLKNSVLSLLLVTAMLVTVFAPMASAASNPTPTNKSFDSSGGTISVSTGQFYQWGCEAQIDPRASSWISYSRLNLYEAQIRIAPNPTYADRTGVVILSGPSNPNGGSKQIKYTITQKAAPVPPPPVTYESIVGSSNSLGWALLENCFGIGVLKKIQPAIKAIGVINNIQKMNNAFAAMREEMVKQARERGISENDIYVMNDGYLTSAGFQLAYFSASLATQKFIPLSQFFINNENNVFLKNFLMYMQEARKILEN